MIPPLASGTASHILMFGNEEEKEEEAEPTKLDSSQIDSDAEIKPEDVEELVREILEEEPEFPQDF